jgi:hypothetical protein
MAASNARLGDTSRFKDAVKKLLIDFLQRVGVPYEQPWSIFRAIMLIADYSTGCYFTQLPES